MAKRNEDITMAEYRAYDLALESIIKTATRGLRYGPAMRSSAALCLEDVREMAARTLGEPEPVAKPAEPGKCPDCEQGYSKSTEPGIMAAYPDHIVLCPLHSAASGLLARAVESLDEAWRGQGNNGGHPLADEIRAAIGAGDRNKNASKSEEGGGV